MAADAGRSVLLIGNFPPPFGGIPTHLAYLAPYLAESGWNVHVVSLKPSKEAHSRLGGFTVHRPARLGKAAKLALLCKGIGRILAHLRCFLKDPREFLRYLHIHSICAAIMRSEGIRLISAYHIFPSGLVGLWLKREFGTPLVTTIFGEIFLDPEFHRNRLPEVELVLGNSDILLSCSVHCAKSPKVLGLPQVAKAVYYGIDVSRFAVTAKGGGLRGRIGIPAADPVVLYLARMEEEMGLGVFLQAIPGLLADKPGLRILVAGRSGPLRPKADELAQEHPGSIFVAADVPVDELPEVYAAATVVLIPSINERACLGLAIAEAMACGKPVVVTEMGGGPEVATHGEHGLLIPPKDADAMRRALLSLVSDPDRAAAMGRAGRARVEAVFDKDRTNRAMEAIFAEALG